MPTSNENGKRGADGKKKDSVKTPQRQGPPSGWVGEYKNQRWYCRCGDDKIAIFPTIAKEGSAHVGKQFWTCKDRKCLMWILEEDAEKAKEYLTVPDTILDTPVSKPKSPPNTMDKYLTKSGKRKAEASSSKTKAKAKAKAKAAPSKTNVINENGNKVLPDGTSVTDSDPEAPEANGAADDDDDEVQFVGGIETPTKKRARRGRPDEKRGPAKRQTMSAKQKGKQPVRPEPINSLPTPESNRSTKSVRLPELGSTQDEPRTFNELAAAAGYEILGTTPASNNRPEPAKGVLRMGDPFVDVAVDGEMGALPDEWVRRLSHALAETERVLSAAVRSAVVEHERENRELKERVRELEEVVRVREARVVELEKWLRDDFGGLIEE